MTLLITGANGYLGQGIVDAVAEVGVRIIAADLRTEKRNPRVTYYDCNIFDIDDPYRYFGMPDAVLHLAWQDGFIHNSEKHIKNLYQHYVFLRKLAISGIRKITVMGSMHEVGFYEGSIDENTPCHPMNLYGVSKNALRETLEILAQEQGFIFQWLRGYYIVGNSAKGSSIFSKIVEAEEKGQKTFPFTTGQNQYDFLDYQDFCNAVAAAVCQEQINGIINICSGCPEKLSDRVERFISENGFKIKLKYGAFPDRPYDSKAVWGNEEKIQKIISRKKSLE